MQYLATAFTRHLRAQRLWAWSHIDNLLLAHPDESYLRCTVQAFVAQLVQAGLRVNPRDTDLTPSRTMSFLGFALNTHTTPQNIFRHA